MIYKRPGKSKFYWTRFTFAGQEIRQSTKTANKKKAEDFEAALRTQLNLGRIGIDTLGNKAAKPLVFEDAMKGFLESLETKESTKRRYTVASKALIAFFGKAIVSSIDSQDVERFRSTRKKAKKLAPVKRLIKTPKATLNKVIRPGTVNRELMLLSGLFKWLIRNGKVSTNPVTDVKKLMEDNEQFRVITDAEFRAYLMACNQPLRDVATIMYDSGLRPSEIFNLRKENIDFENARICITTGKTKAARRKIRMTARVSGILGARYDKAEGDLLFPGGKKGNKETPIVKLTNSHLAAIKRVNDAAKETGGQTIAPFRLYDLRHTFATRLTSSGVDLMTASVILGHSRLEMIRRYSHPTEQHQADAIEHLEQQDSNVKAFRRSA